MIPKNNAAAAGQLLARSRSPIGKRTLDQMSHQPHKRTPENRQTDRATPAQFTSADALAHVGRTLESEGIYDDLLGTYVLDPEGKVEKDIGLVSVEPGPVVTELSYDTVCDCVIAAPGAEPLKTRLPGDTSSDPHTDVGQDNAANVPGRDQEEPH